MTHCRLAAVKRISSSLALPISRVVIFLGVFLTGPCLENLAVGQSSPFPRRVRAPALPANLEWLNTGGPIPFEALRGKFVLLDFWTYCCINCMHLLPELEKLEKAYPQELVVIGVHSPKFDAERDSGRVLEAIRRYGIRHPVINDKNRQLWDLFEVRAWPTLVLIDPEGYVVWGKSGETPFEALDAVLRPAIAFYKQRGLMDLTPLGFGVAVRQPKELPLHYPGKILADESSQRLFVADSGHHRIVVLTLTGDLVEVIGSGKRALRDGRFEEACFNDPQGMALKGSLLYVADTKNHAIRKIDLEQKTVQTIAGTGRQLNVPGPLRPTNPRRQALASPWDLCIHNDYLYIAMAGTHQIWRMSLDETSIEVYAGNGREDIVDGRPRPIRPFEFGASSFAQPSGLATDGTWLYVADSEGSSIRAVPLLPGGQVRTVVGTAHLPVARLFTFGDVDGPSTVARLQHPLGVAFYNDVLYVADTYNNKIRKVDPKTGMTETFVGSAERGATDRPPRFFEPGGLSAAAGKLFVADTNNHAIRVVDIRSKEVTTLPLTGLQPPNVPESLAEPQEVASRREFRINERFVVAAADGQVTLRIVLPLTPGWKINPLAPMSYRLEELSPSGDEVGLLDPQITGREIILARPQQSLELPLRFRRQEGQTQTRITVTFFTCTEGQEGLCRIETARWEFQVELRPDAASRTIELRAE
jgi:DNA-binding beta-propeller fold protein YncE